MREIRVPVKVTPCELVAPPPLPPLPASASLSASEIALQATFDEHYLEWTEDVRSCPLVKIR